MAEDFRVKFIELLIHFNYANYHAMMGFMK